MDDVVCCICKFGKVVILIFVIVILLLLLELFKEEVKLIEEKIEEIIVLVEEGKLKNKGGKSFRKIFCLKMFKMFEVKMLKFVINVLFKFLDCCNLFKGIFDSCNMFKFMGEFMLKGVFYVVDGMIDLD